MYVLDTECYSNLWLLCLQHKDTNQRLTFSARDGEALPEDARAAIQSILRINHTVGFNSLSYDLPMISAAVVDGYDTKQLKDLSDKIILSEQASWMTCNQEGISIPERWLKKHIDLIEIAIGQASLKIYGGRLNCPTMQDLPLDPALPVPSDSFDEIVQYCFNDIHLTTLLLDHLWKQVKLRDQISKRYGINLRSKSDAQMAEAVIKKLVSEAKGQPVYKPKQAPSFVVYTPPAYIEFDSPELQQILEAIVDTSFAIHKGNGSVVMPEWLAKTVIQIDGAKYQMGIGGLHSCEKKQFVQAGDDHVLVDWDVASMYPTMIVNQGLAPENMGKDFTEIYRGFVSERLTAKHSGDKVTADTLKIFLNGSFGKFGSRFSILYSPKLLIQTTLTGQLSLLMLIERVTRAGIRVVSANTDGVVMLCPKDQQGIMNQITFEWMLDTNMLLEETHYRLIASRDVNSYVAIKTDGEIKRKGAFADTSLAKNPDRLIIYDAVCAFLANGDPIINTVMNCKDASRFVTIRRVTGGAMWQGKEVGKAVRFYHSETVPKDVSLTYKKNGNKVPNSDGCRPLMVMNRLPADIDYLYYIQESRKLLKEVGYA